MELALGWQRKNKAHGGCAMSGCRFKRVLADGNGGNTNLAAIQIHELFHERHAKSGACFAGSFLPDCACGRIKDFTHEILWHADSFILDFEDDLLAFNLALNVDRAVWKGKLDDIGKNVGEDTVNKRYGFDPQQARRSTGEEESGEKTLLQGACRQRMKNSRHGWQGNVIVCRLKTLTRYRSHMRLEELLNQN